MGVTKMHSHAPLPPPATGQVMSVWEYAEGYELLAASEVITDVPAVIKSYVTHRAVPLRDRRYEVGNLRI